MNESTNYKSNPIANLTVDDIMQHPVLQSLPMRENHIMRLMQSPVLLSRRQRRRLRRLSVLMEKIAIALGEAGTGAGMSDIPRRFSHKPLRPMTSGQYDKKYARWVKELEQILYYEEGRYSHMWEALVKHYSDSIESIDSWPNPYGEDD